MDNTNKIQDMYESYELEVEELELQGTRKLAETIIIYKNKNNTLNKGIDELIEKYEDEIKSIKKDKFGYGDLEGGIVQGLEEAIQDLKSLKGE